MENINERLVITKEDVNCNKFADMENLKELIFHDCHIENLSALVKVPYLKILGFSGCDFGNELLPALAGAPELARINLHRMDAAGLEGLHGLRNLKRLGLWNVTGFKLENLAICENLFTLEMDDIGFSSSDIISKLVNLKVLYLYHSVMDNLDFLKMLPKLHKFMLLNPAQNEDGLIAVRSLANIKEFLYPVRDLSVYKGCMKLRKIGVSSSGVYGFEALEGSQIDEFTVCGRNIKDREYVEKISKKMKKYIKLSCYGFSA